MKEDELRKLSKCSFCKKLIGSAPIPIFHTLHINTYGIDIKAVKRQTGLEMMLGNVQLAQVFSQDEDLAKEIDSSKYVVCSDCWNKGINTHEISETKPEVE